MCSLHSVDGSNNDSIDVTRPECDSLTLLLRYTDSPSSPSSRLGVLSTDAQAPVVS
jgi:hypothetical protein